MKLGFFTITEWVAVLGFVSGLFFSFAKLYSTLQSILSKLETLVLNFEDSKQDRALLHREIDQLKLDVAQQKIQVNEQLKSAFKNIGDIAKYEYGKGRTSK